MQNQRIENIAAFIINITKVLLIIYLGVEEVFKIIKSLQKDLDTELDISKKWASQNYSILKKLAVLMKFAFMSEELFLLCKCFFKRLKLD